MSSAPPDHERSDVETEAAPDASDRALVGTTFIVGGPLGLLIAIFLSFWVSSQHVEFTVSAHVETQWVAHESLAVRAQWVSERPTPIAGSGGDFWVEQGGQRHALGELRPTPKEGLVQATFSVPALALGPAELHLRLHADDIEARHEIVPLEVVRKRAVRPPTPLWSGSNLQHGDDSEPQPVGMRIEVLPARRWLTQFDNTVHVRVLHPDGRPFQGTIEVLLASGEFMGHSGKLAEPVTLRSGSTDALGLLTLEGLLTSEVVRLQVHVLDASDATRVLHRRRVYLVTHAGGVRVDASPRVVAPTAVALQVRGHGFSRSRPVFVDVHGPDGAWIGTLDPPFVGAEPPRPWSVGPLEPGVLQLEAYHFTNSPGASTAFERVWVDPAPPQDSASLRGLLDIYRQSLSLPRLDREYDANVEGLYLDWLSTHVREPAEVERARTFLLDTLPAAIYGPPTALVTRERDHRAMLELKRRWTLGIRWFLLGGGAVFLVLMTTMMMLDYVRGLRKTTAAMQHLEMLDAASADFEFRRAARAGLVRGLIMVAIIAGGLVLTIVVLENLFWVT